jgi:hypothetical protein
MKRYALYISTLLIVIGIVGRLYADQNTYVTPEGILVESAWLPIGTLMILVGVLALFVLGVLYIISYLRERRRR